MGVRFRLAAGAEANHIKFCLNPVLPPCFQVWYVHWVQCSLMKRFLSRVAISVSLVPLGLWAPSVNAQALDTGTSTFTGSVPDSCEFTNGDPSVNMTLSGTTLSGTTPNITVVTNGAVNLSLTSLTEVSKGAGSTPTATATLNDITDSEDGIATATVGGDSGSVALGNTPNVNHNVTVGMTVADADAPGTYTYTVILSCLGS